MLGKDRFQFLCCWSSQSCNKNSCQSVGYREIQGPRFEIDSFKLSAEEVGKGSCDRAEPGQVKGRVGVLIIRRQDRYLEIPNNWLILRFVRNIFKDDKLTSYSCEDIN